VVWSGIRAQPGTTHYEHHTDECMFLCSLCDCQSGLNRWDVGVIRQLIARSIGTGPIQPSWTLIGTTPTPTSSLALANIAWRNWRFRMTCQLNYQAHCTCWRYLDRAMTGNTAAYMLHFPSRYCSGRWLNRLGRRQTISVFNLSWGLSLALSPVLVLVRSC
jgi:hypothetical protein